MEKNPVEKLQEQCNSHPDYIPYLQETIASLRKLVPMWINCQHRLPENPINIYESKRYLIAQDESWMEVSHYQGNGEWEHSNVTHWMPLPPQPSEDHIEDKLGMVEDPSKDYSKLTLEEWKELLTSEFLANITQEKWEELRGDSPIVPHEFNKMKDDANRL